MNNENFLDRRTFLGGSVALATASVLPSHALATTGRQADIAILGDILETLHPGLYRYLTPEAFRDNLEALDVLWRTQPALEQRYLNLSRFLATIKCGHTYANFFNQKKAVAQQLFERANRLPAAFRWIGNELVVLADQTGSGKLPRGTVIRSINNIPSKSILSDLLPLARADGGNDAKRRALMAVSGADTLESFDVFFGLQHDLRDYQLLVRLPGEAIDREVALPALTLPQRRAFMRSSDYSGETAVWDWTMRQDGIAVLTMDGWALYDSKWNWRQWLDDRLDSLKGAKGLIVDIRLNEGGEDCGDLILSRLASTDIVRPRSKTLVRYAKVPERLNPYLDTWDDSFRDWGDKVDPYSERFFNLRRWDDGGVLAVRDKPVSLPVAVLIGPQNSSATFQFAELCKVTKLATLVGEQTGGNRRGINGGAFFFARLPESGLEFDVPLLGYFPEGRQPDAGIIPDISAVQSKSDIASGYDRQMERAAMHLIRR